MTKFAFVENGTVTTTSQPVIAAEIVRVHGVQVPPAFFTDRYSEAERKELGTYTVEQTNAQPPHDPVFEWLELTDPTYNAGNDTVTETWMVSALPHEDSQRQVRFQAEQIYKGVREQGINHAAMPGVVLGTDDVAWRLVRTSKDGYDFSVLRTPPTCALVRYMDGNGDRSLVEVPDQATFDAIWQDMTAHAMACSGRALELQEQINATTNRAELEPVRDALGTGWPPQPTYE